MSRPASLEGSMSYRFSKTAAAYAKNHADKIDEYFTDPDGHWVWSARGWAFDGHMSHCKRQDTAKDIVAVMREVRPCDCEDCKGDFRKKRGDA